jgi:hypothetical protein
VIVYEDAGGRDAFIAEGYHGRGLPLALMAELR